MEFHNIYVAASNTREELRNKADLVCTGEHDEIVLQNAIDLAVRDGKNIFLLNGKYIIDGFSDRGDNGPLTAVCVPNAHREIAILGQNHEY